MEEQICLIFTKWEYFPISCNPGTHKESKQIQEWSLVILLLQGCFGKWIQVICQEEKVVPSITFSYPIMQYLVIAAPNPQTQPDPTQVSCNRKHFQVQVRDHGAPIALQLAQYLKCKLIWSQ